MKPIGAISHFWFLILRTIQITTLSLGLLRLVEKQLSLIYRRLKLILFLFCTIMPLNYEINCNKRELIKYHKWEFYASDSWPFSNLQSIIVRKLNRIRTSNTKTRPNQMFKSTWSRKYPQKSSWFINIIMYI